MRRKWIKAGMLMALAWGVACHGAVTAAPSALPSPHPPDQSGPRVQINVDSVRPELGVMATVTWQMRAEQSRCVTRWRMERNQGRLTITLLALGPSEVAASDSVQVWFYPSRVPWDTGFVPRICGDSLPDIHSHILDNGFLLRPSETDLAMAARHPAPFRFLLSVTDSNRMSLTAYGIRGRP